MADRYPSGGTRGPSEMERRAASRKDIIERGSGGASLAPTILAGLFFGSIGAYAALKYAPKGKVAEAGKFLQKVLERPERHGIPKKLATAIQSFMEKAGDRLGKSAHHMSASSTIKEIVYRSGFADPEVARALKRLRDSVAKRPQSFGAVGDILSAVDQEPPTTLFGARRLTVGDLFDQAGEWKSVLGKTPKELGETAGVIKDIYSRVPALKTTVANLPVGNGLFYYQDKVLDVSHFTPGHWVKKLDDAAKGGSVLARLGRWTLGLMAPSGLMAKTPPISLVHKASLTPYLDKAYTGAAEFMRREVTEGINIGGTLFPVTRGGDIGAAVAKNVALVPTRSNIGRMIRETARAAPKIDPWLEQNAASMAKLGIFKKPAEMGLRFLNKIGVGPHLVYGADPAVSAAMQNETIVGKLYRTLQQPGREARKTLTNIGGMIAGRTPAPAPEYAYSAASTIKAIDHFANFQLSRVGQLLESTVGMGLKPGQTSFGTLGRWMALAGVGWAGYKYAGYANYIGRELTGVGPLDVPVYGYMGARMGMQGAIDLMGVDNVANYLETTFPGSVKSPGSRILQGLGAAQLAKKFGAPGAVVAGMGALAFGTDLTMSAERLGKIYSGEEEVAVRRSRYWMLGCLHPDQPVLLANGHIKAANEVCIGDILVDRHGSPVTVLATQVRDTDPETERLFTIHIKGFPIPTLVTGNHEILVHRNQCPYKQYKSGCHPRRKSGVLCSRLIAGPNTKCTYSDTLKLVWVRADALRESDYVVLPRRNPAHDSVVLDLRGIEVPYIEDESGNIKCAQKKAAGGIQGAPHNDWVSPQLDTDYRLGELLGWIFAEGSVHTIGRSVECVYHIQERSWAERMSSHAAALLGVRSAHSTRGGNTGRTVLSGRFLATLCRLLGLVPNKHINTDHLLGFGREFVTGFLRGAFYGDGCRNATGWSLKTKSLESAVAVRDLLVSVGSAARISRSNSRFNGTEFEAWVVAITDPADLSLVKSYVEEKPKGTEKNHSCIGFDEYVITPISSIEVSGPPQEVHDFHVSGSESFCLPGHVVHNSSSYFGGPVEYHRPHLLSMALTDYKKEAIYGSASNYWKYGTFLPTPSNLLGALPFANPYFAEERNYFSRPYPVTGSFGGEVPLIGPAIEATVGRLIKPRSKMHREYWHGDTLLEPGRFPAVRGRMMPGTTADSRQHGSEPVSSLRLDQAVGRQVDVLRDFTGLPGFLLGAVKSKITGSSDFFSTSRQIANSGEMTSYERAYYDMRLGGLASLTEGFRRFLPHKRRQIEQANPIVNDMPGWMPGSYSAFPEDRDYYKDMHRGDPYVRIPHGEARLPGPGYEALHRLHSGVPGCYDAYDRYKILADVAPDSEAFKHYETIVRGQIATGSMSEESEGKHLEGLLGTDIDGIVQRVVDGDTMEIDIGGRLTTVRMAGINTPESESTRRRENTAEGQLVSKWTKEQYEGRRVSVAPVDIDPHGRLVANVERRGDIIARDPTELLKEAYPSARFTDEERAKFYTLQDRVRQRFEPHQFYEKIFSDPLAVVPRNARKLQTLSQDQFNEAVAEAGEYTLPEKLAGAAYERVSHIEPPGPARWFKDKWFPIRSAEEHYRRNRVLGNSFSNWERPYESFMRYWPYATADFFTPGHTVVPPNVKRRWEVESYFDRMKYAKAKRLSNESIRVGDIEAAKYWQKESKKTVNYALATGNTHLVRSGLPRGDRAYYNAFTRVRSSEERDRIRSIVSPDMRSLLEASWSGTSPTRTDPDVEAAAHLGSTSIPDRDWAGWRPDVNLDMAKVRVAQDEHIDYHELGATRADAMASEDMLGDWDVPDIPDFSAVARMRAHIYRMLRESGYSDISVDVDQMPSYDNRSRVRMHHYRSPSYNIGRFLGYDRSGYDMRY